MTPTIGYWNVRGLVAPIKYLLAYAGINYEDKRYSFGPPPTFDRSEWLNEKFTLGLDFPNLPYYIDGDVKLTQSGVILRYLGRKHGLDGSTEQERHRLEILLAQLYDYHMDSVPIVYNPQFLQLKDEYIKNLPAKLKLLTDFLQDRHFVAGNHITYVDFFLFEYLSVQIQFVEDILKNYPALEKFYERFLSLEPIVKHFSKPENNKLPYYGASAYFGGPYSDQLASGE